MNTLSSAVVLYSGGLDSYAALWNAASSNHEVLAVRFEFGQQAIAQERAAVSALPLPKNVTLSTVELPDLGGSTGFVPARNAVLLSHAANIAVRMGIRSIVTGLTGYPEDARVDAYEEAVCWPDATKTFIESFNRMMSEGGVDVVVSSPVMGMTRNSTLYMIEAFSDRDTAILAGSVASSCDEPNAPCGECQACVTRAIALEEYLANA